jgi:hypothetical protein
MPKYEYRQLPEQFDDMRNRAVHFAGSALTGLRSDQA